MFGRIHREPIVSPPPAGVSELVFCIADEKQKVRYHLQAGKIESGEMEAFRLIEGTRRVSHPLLDHVFTTRSPLTLSLSQGGCQVHLYILPYEKKWNKWRFACLQVTTLPPDPDRGDQAGSCGLAEDRGCLLLVDADQAIRSVGSHVPAAFGYAPGDLGRMHLNDLFSPSDFETLRMWPADTNESMESCKLVCLDGSRRNVEIKKFSTPEDFALYAICDKLTQPTQNMEDFTEATARERRRIGQDLHDSIGQTLTGISLLSRSLSNLLRRDGHGGHDDASQISGLADEASNQIRQISRGLMPSEIVQQGLLASLRRLAQVTTASCGILCETRLDASLKFADVAVETHLYRITQEAVNNAVRHSGASRIDIVVSEANGMQQLEVIDNGRWVEPEADVVGIGLKTMEYRASVVGGRLRVDTAPHGGTRVICQLEADEHLTTHEDNLVPVEGK